MTSSTASSPRWRARVSAKRYELRGSYTVFVFVGEVPANSRNWPTDPHLAGVFSVFANDTPEPGNNNAEGFVYLDDALKDAGLESLEEDDVTSFLTDEAHLNWAVSTAGGRILRSKDLDAYFPSLKIVIVERTDHKAPMHGGYKSFPDVTRGRPGGYRDD